MRRALVLAVGGVAMLLAWTGAASAETCKPVVGHFEAAVVPPGEGHCPDA